MRELTNEEYEELKKYDRHFITAIEGQYIYNMSPSEASIIFNIYNKVFCKFEKNLYCMSCRLRIVQLLGKLYFERKEVENNGRKKGRKKSKVKKEA